MTVRIDNSGVDKFGEAFPVIFAILVILMLVVIAANFILRTKDDSKEAIRRKVKILEKQSNAGAEWYIVECENGERLRLRNFQGYKVFITVGDEGILEYKGLTIKSFQKNYIIQELTDSTLVLQYLPESLTIGVTPVRCTTDNSVQGQRQNEERLDSIWRKEDIWNKGVAKITGEPIKDLSTIEPPRWAVWDYDLTKYYVSQMKYPEELLKKNVAGYSVVMFALDTLGLPRWNTILTTIHEDFDKEVIRLTKELPHCLPCRNKNGKRMECLYTVYVPFLPQHYRDRVKADSVREEELKQSFVEWEAVSYFEKANPYAITNYINERLTYDSNLLNGKKEIKGIYTIRIDSYGEIIKVETLRGCGIQEWDNQVLQIIKGMPRWTPTINFHGKGEYRNSVWTVPVLFKNDSPTKNEVNNYNWLIKTLSKSCKYPPKLQKKNREGMVYVTYKLDGNGYITNPQVISCNNRKFKRAALNAFNAVMGISITLPAPKDTLVFQFKLDRPTTPINPHTDVLIIGYSSCDTPILMRYDATLTAHTTEPYLEVGVPVCYLNERGDTIVPYGKYRYCQTDTIKKIGFVYENKPKESMLTSFSVLFAAYKGDLPYYVQGAKAIDSLTPDSKVLIAECCTHAPLKEDIGRVKIPRMLKKCAGETLTVDIVSGTDFPQDLSGYDLIIQCGACMFNRKYVLSRIDRAKKQQVPMTNYGVTIAHLTGILDNISMP